MRIKKQNKNEYILSDDIWVRNSFSSFDSLDINNLSKNDISLFLNNEIKNNKKKFIKRDEFLNIELENVIICSDGYQWEERQKILAEIPNKLVKIIGVNGSLSKWKMVGDLSDKKRVMSFYLVNNPYKECMRYIPRKHRYYPPLIASVRTNPDFLEKYLEEPLFYTPTKDINYSGIKKEGCITLDEYRNSICAAISFCVKAKAKKILLFCCDESFSENKSGSKKMENGLYQYPTQIKSQKIIDSQFYWLKKHKIKIADCSSGIKYENASYIKMEEIESFFIN